jgi:hypothetical protein
MTGRGSSIDLEALRRVTASYGADILPGMQDVKTADYLGLVATIWLHVLFLGLSMLLYYFRFSISGVAEMCRERSCRRWSNR